MARSPRIDASRLEEWAIKCQINYILQVQKASRVRLYRMLLIGSVGIPAYLIGAYKLSELVTAGDNRAYIDSILLLLLMSPVIVLAFSLMYFSERDAGHKYAEYVREQMASLIVSNTKFSAWEKWVKDDRQIKRNFKYELQRSLAIYLLMITYFLASVAFASASAVKLLEGRIYAPQLGYFISLAFLILAILVWWIVAKCPIWLRQRLLGDLDRDKKS